MNFYSLEVADLSWRAELLPTTKVSVYLNCKRERCFRGWCKSEGKEHWNRLYSTGRGYKRWTAGKGKAKGYVHNSFSTSFFSFLFSFLFKVVMLKLLDYPSLSHIVIQVPPAAGNKVKKYDIQELFA